MFVPFFSCNVIARATSLSSDSILLWIIFLVRNDKSWARQMQLKAANQAERKRQSTHQDETERPSRIEIERAPRPELETQVAVDSPLLVRPATIKGPVRKKSPKE